MKAIKVVTVNASGLSGRKLRRRIGQVSKEAIALYKERRKSQSSSDVWANIQREVKLSNL